MYVAKDYSIIELAESMKRTGDLRKAKHTQLPLSFS